MKSIQLKEMNKLELETKLNDNLEALQNLYFQKALQQLEDGTLISKNKKRSKTVQKKNGPRMLMTKNLEKFQHSFGLIQKSLICLLENGQKTC